MMTNHDIVSLLVTCQLAAPAATVAIVGVPALLGRPPSVLRVNRRPPGIGRGSGL